MPAWDKRKEKQCVGKTRNYFDLVLVLFGILQLFCGLNFLEQKGNVCTVVICKNLVIIHTLLMQ